MLREWQADKNRAAYEAELTRVKDAAQARIDAAAQTGQAAEDVPVVDRLFHTFVSMAGGDFDKAYEGYKSFYTEFQSEAAPGQEQAQATTTNQAPPTLGSQHATPAGTPPTVEKYETIDDALDAFFNEQRSSGPPTIGSV